MPVRKITAKADRVKVVNWIRAGAKLKEGISLYAGLRGDKQLIVRLKQNPAKYQDAMIADFCAMMGISLKKFRVQSSEFKVQSEPATGNQQPLTNNKQPTRSRSFRSQWPFLSRPECPPELKALAADKITAWENYTAAHKRLFDCSSIDECYQTAFELVENYKENRLIHEEFEYYLKHGAVLGKHPVFNQYKKFEHLRGLNVIDLVKLHEITLPHRIWRIESVIKQADKPHLLGERQQRLNEVRAELGEVKRLLGING
jgi:hypothetical protein